MLFRLPHITGTSKCQQVTSDNDGLNITPGCTTYNSINPGSLTLSWRKPGSGKVWSCTVRLTLDELVTFKSELERAIDYYRKNLEARIQDSQEEAQKLQQRLRDLNEKESDALDAAIDRATS